jgi:hypothetical protein
MYLGTRHGVFGFYPQIQATLPFQIFLLFIDSDFVLAEKLSAPTLVRNCQRCCRCGAEPGIGTAHLSGVLSLIMGAIEPALHSTLRRPEFTSERFRPSRSEEP